MLQTVLNAAVQASNAGLSLSDLAGEDAPLVWITAGFMRLNGWARVEAIGRNCRFLQTDATDVAAVYEMRRAIEARVHTRVHLWNEDKSGHGSWALISLVPGRDDASASMGSSQCEAPVERARYVMGVQHSVSAAQMRFIFEHVMAYRQAAQAVAVQAAWCSPQPSPQQYLRPGFLSQPSNALQSTESPPAASSPAANRPLLPSSPANQRPAALPSSPRTFLRASTTSLGGSSNTGSPATSLTDASARFLSALAQWESEFERLKGRRPGREDAAAMMLEAYTKLQDGRSAGGGGGADTLADLQRPARRRSRSSNDPSPGQATPPLRNHERLSPSMEDDETQQRS